MAENEGDTGTRDLGPPDTATMFTALLQEMQKMNRNFTSLHDPVDEQSLLDEEEKGDSGDEAPEGSGAHASLEDQVSELTRDNDSEKDLLADIAVDLDSSEKTGPAISDGLAGIVVSLLREKFSDDKTQSKIEQYLRPANVEGLRTPRVNHLIWNQLAAPVRTQDSKAQKSQNAQVAAIVAMLRATDAVLKRSASADTKELVKTMTDAIALAVQAYHDMNVGRRQAMKKALNKDYAALCSTSTVEPLSEYLFGDLSKLTKDITDANKLTKKVRPSNNTQQGSYGRGRGQGGRRNSGYQNNRFKPYSRGRNDFLSKGNSPKGRLKQEGSAKQ